MELTCRTLNMSDAALLQELLESNPSYSRRVSGRDPHPDDSRTILTARPPGMNSESKYAWGIWESGKLIACVDVVRGYPRAEVAHIGLLIVAGDQSRRGVGRQTYERVLKEIRTWSEVAAVHLGIVATNAEAAEPFWESLGYLRTGESKPYVDGAVDSIVTFWESPLLGTIPA